MPERDQTGLPSFLPDSTAVKDRTKTGSIVSTFLAGSAGVVGVGRDAGAASSAPTPLAAAISATRHHAAIPEQRPPLLRSTSVIPYRYKFLIWSQYFWAAWRLCS